jgi:hypothetical protein
MSKIVQVVDLKYKIPRTFKDMSGQHFGNWIAIKPSEERFGKSLGWVCKCSSCGLEKVFAGSELRRGRFSKCGCADPMQQSFSGKKFGKLTVLDKEEHIKINESGRTILKCLCECECGNKGFYISKYNLFIGWTKTCGKCENKTREVGRGYIDSSGYVKIYAPDHPNADKNGDVLQHVIVMSKHLDRPLRKGEFVHHKNGIRTDNNLENLELWTRAHPPGQRPKELLEFAKKIISEYESEVVSGKII